MNEMTSQRFGYNFWWIGAIAMMLFFNLLLIGSALISKPILVQFDLDGTRRDLMEGLKFAIFYGDLAFAVVTFISSLLAFFVLNKPCHARRAKIWLLGTVGLLFWGALLSVGWRFDVATSETSQLLPLAFPVDVLHLLFLGLPLLWSLALLWIAFRWREEELYDSTDY